MYINSISYNKYNYNNSPKLKRTPNNNQPSFKGVIPEPVVKGLSTFYDKVVKTQPFQKFIRWFSTSDNSFKHLMLAESCFLSGFYMINTLRNKKIKKEQKPQMLINDTLTLGVSSAGAYLLDGKVTNLVNKAADKYFIKNQDFYAKLGAQTKEALQGELLTKTAEITTLNDPNMIKNGLKEAGNLIKDQMKGLVGEKESLKAFQMTADDLAALQKKVKTAIKLNANNPDKAKQAVAKITDKAYTSLSARKEADRIIPGINKLKVLIILGLIYRFLGPVVITPIANKLSSKLLKKEDKTSKKAN